MIIIKKDKISTTKIPSCLRYNMVNYLTAKQIEWIESLRDFGALVRL